jgi:hypothetical protein
VRTLAGLEGFAAFERRFWRFMVGELLRHVSQGGLASKCTFTTTFSTDHGHEWDVYDATRIYM